ncbi:MAG: Glu-tRNA(Gln) amidotransferase subunit GatD [Candidatus Anstonellaceae archaeon]
MYNKKILEILKKHNISIGDKIEVIYPDRTYQGILLDRQKGGNENCIVLKLSLGYNIGLNITNAKLSKLSGGVCLESSSSNEKEKEKKEDFENASVLLMSGGTISSKVDYLTGAVDSKLNSEQLIQLYPEIKNFGKIATKNLFTLLSENIAQDEWEKMAQEIKNIFDDQASSIVLLHGTDTMGYTAAALSYSLEGLGKPVILTGSQRSSDRPSSDAKQNLLCSLAASKENIAGVFVCMHATTSDNYNFLHLGTRVRKNHTTARWAFKSIGIKPVGKIFAQNFKVEFDPFFVPKPRSLNKINLKNKFSKNVHIAWGYPGIGVEEIKHWTKYDGVVLVGTGMGHFPIYSQHPKIEKKILSELKELVDSGIVLVMASQAIEGRIMLQTYSTGRLLEDIGIIGNGCDWLVETAYVKLCWALGQTKNPKKVKEIMLTPINNDITPYSIVQTAQDEEQGQ